MYERMSGEAHRPDAFTFDLGAGPMEHLSPESLGHTEPEQSSNTPEDNAFFASDSNSTNESAPNSVACKDGSSKDVDRSPDLLTRGTSNGWLSTTFDAMISLVPLFFLVVAVLCLCLNHQPTSPYGENVKAITLLSPTLFPIVYAAILGKVLRRIGLFKAERSSTIGTLEQLIGSQSFFASVEKQFALRRVDFLGVAIIAAWLLSPLGGQASLRLLSTKPSTATFNTTIKYHSIAGFANDTMISEHMTEYSWSRFAPLYMTALQTSRQTFQEPRDLFGNVRIPEIRSLHPLETALNSSVEWCNVGDRTTTMYTSLLGRPIADIPGLGNISFTLESSYWHVRCDPFVGSIMQGESYHGLSRGPSKNSFTIDLSWIKNISTPTGRTAQIGFDYLSRTSYNTLINSTCSATFRLVESEVGCVNAACGVRKMRNLDRDTTRWFGLNPEGTFPFRNWKTMFLLLLEQMPAADLKGTTRTSELVEQFIADPYLGTMANSGDGSNMDKYWVDLSTISTQDFSQRLQIAINTFWDSTIGLQYRIGNLTTQDIKGRKTSHLAWNTTTATGERYDGDRYVCNTTFAALTIAISLFMFIAGSSSAVLSLVTRAPDILGYVSTYARDDPYFSQHVPSYLDGMETARKLQDVRVIIGDIRKNEDVGHIAFASMDIGPERVVKQRLYD